jgi:methionine synthase II (cobalamin-independent)
MIAEITKEFVLSAIFVPIIVAVIAGPVVAIVKKFDENNTSQHARSMNVLNSIQSNLSDLKSDVGMIQLDTRIIQSDVKQIDARLNEHIDWHLTKKGD